MEGWQIVCLVVGLPVILFKIYVEIVKGKCTSKADLTGKTAIVTGANTGIGFWTALDLARRNARVILACRDISKAQDAVKKIQAETGNNNVVVRQLDISLMKCVREFAEKFIAEEPRLDILVNNAGVARLPFIKTEEGFEPVFATNHFGPFLLTNLLLDLLKKSGQSRIVNVSSAVHIFVRNPADFHFDNLKGEKGESTGHSFYRLSKLANMWFTRELARRLGGTGTGVGVYCLHPGVVASDIWRFFQFPMAVLFAIPKYLFFKSSEEGAQTNIYCAVSEEVDGVSGKYYVDCREAEGQSSELSKDSGLAKKLWEISEKYTGLVKTD